MNCQDRPFLILSTAHREGTGAYIILSEFLKESVGKPENFQVICPRESHIGDTLEETGRDRVWLETKRDGLFWNLWGLLHCFRQIKPPRLVVAWHSRGYELAWLLGLIFRVPTVGVIHDHPVCFVHSRTRRWMIRLFARKLTHLIAVSEAVAVPWRKHVDSNKITVIRNGLSDIPDTQKNKKSENEGVQIGFLGMYQFGKGFHIIYEWIHATRDMNVYWRLYGNVTPSLQSMVEKLLDEHSDRVTICGIRKPIEIFNEINILVHASTSFDPFPTVLLEAARSGVPAIASSLGGSVECVVDGETGYIFDPEQPETGLEKLRYLLRSREKNEQIGVSARKRFETNFHIPKMYFKYIECWNELI